MTKTKWEVTFNFEDEFDEKEWLEENGGTFMDAWSDYYDYVKKDIIGKLETRADNCLPSNYNMNYHVRIIE